MEDEGILALYRCRDERAILETRQKYGAYCRTIAQNILHSPEDAEETVSDAYIGAWNAIPPHAPKRLSTFLGRITRNLALKRLRERTTEKRGGGKTLLALEELEDCIPDDRSLDDRLEARALTELLDRFLESLPVTERRVFLRRYWYFDSVEDIARRYGFSQSKVKSMTKRTRDKLRLQLQKEDIWV